LKTVKPVVGYGITPLVESTAVYCLTINTVSDIVCLLDHSKSSTKSMSYIAYRHKSHNILNLLFVLSPECQNLLTSLLFLISSLVHSKRTYQIQTPFSNLKGSHNKPTSISPLLDFCSLSQHTFFIYGHS